MVFSIYGLGHTLSNTFLNWQLTTECKIKSVRLTAMNIFSAFSLILLSGRIGLLESVYISFKMSAPSI